MVTIAPAISYKFTVDEFDRMAEAGIFHEDDRVELIEGEIICMSAVGNRHFWAVTKLTDAFAPLAAAQKASISVQNPVVIHQRAKPQPDLVLLQYHPHPDRDRPARPSDVLLLVEVSDSSVDYDRLTKVPLYARAAIPEVWLIDLTQNQIEVYCKPSEGAYSEERIYSRGETLSPVAFRDLSITVEDIIG